MAKTDKPAAGTLPAAAEQAAAEQAAAEQVAAEQAAAEQAAAEQAAAALASITVRAASAKGRWRTARHFTQEPQVLLLGDLAEGDLEELQGDPELIVEFGD